MSAREILRRLREQGVELWVEGDRLRFRAPTGALSDELRAEVAARRAELVELVRSAGAPAPAPDPAERYAPFPLSEMQQAYWLGRQGIYELGEIAAHGYFEFESGSIDVDRLELAWRKLVARHDMLRAVVQPDGQQRILERVPDYRIERVDLRGLPPGEAAARLEAERERMSHEVLPADTWPLFRLRACLLDGPPRVRLLVSLDMLIMDAQSFFVLFREWSERYERPEEEPPPPPRVSFRDYVLAEQAKQASDDHRRSLEVWRERVASMPAGPEIDAPARAGAAPPPRFTRRTGTLDRAAWARFVERAGARRLTPSMALCAAYARVLGRWSRRPRFTLNLTLLGRSPDYPDIDQVIGDFTSGLLLEIDDAAPGSLAEQASRMMDRFWRDMEHARVGSVHVLRELSRVHGRVEAAAPIVFTSLLDTRRDGVAATAWLGERVYGVSQTPQVSLDHQVFEEEGALVFNWDAVEDRFLPGHIERMFSAYCRLLERMADGDAAWDDAAVELLPEQDLAPRAAANATEAPLSGELLHTLFRRRAAEAPDRVALLGRGRAMTYGELHRRSNQLARALLARRAPLRRLVAVVMEKGFEQVVAVLGILKAGAAYLPIDPGIPAERLHLLLRDGEADLALTQPWVDARVEWPEGVERVVVSDDPQTGAGADDSDLPVERAPEDLAYVIYTSGSTGAPKGVMIDHRGAVNTILDVNERFGVGPDDRVFAVSALTFDLSVYDIFGALAAGAAIVVPEPGTGDAEAWAEAVREDGVTIWSSVPALLEMLLERWKPEGARAPRLIMLSGDWIPVDLPGRARRAMPGVELMSLGGATEASIWSILYPIGEVDRSWKSIPYGRPMRNQSFHVLTARLEPRPTGIAGELYIGGIGLAQGYWRDEARTRERFIVHPRTGQRLYRTGDIGRYLESGDIELFGREDHQVKILGYRIECGEIEAALRAHPGVRDALVAARDDDGRGKRLVAYVVGSPGDEPAADDLRRFLGAKLPAYMIPTAFVALERLPLGPNGKVDRRALPAPGGRAPEAGARIAPRTPGEATIAGLFGALLGTEDVDVRANFFELGGDSLKATRLATMLQSAFGVDVTVRRLLDDPSVAGIAEVIEELLIDELIAREAETPAEATDTTP